MEKEKKARIGGRLKCEVIAAESTPFLRLFLFVSVVTRPPVLLHTLPLCYIIYNSLYCEHMKQWGLTRGCIGYYFLVSLFPSPLSYVPSPSPSSILYLFYNIIIIDNM